MSKALGLPSDELYDVLKPGYMSASFIDYTFGNLDDGQDSASVNVYGKRTNVSLTLQEFDVYSILN